MRSNKGFTLVEMAIVLVIIGLLLGGVLKGQELIDGTKVKKAVNDMNAISAGFNGYQDRYVRMPGDDGGTAVATGSLAGLTGRGGSWATVTLFGNNNGTLNSTGPNVFLATDNEEQVLFQELRAAGFITGNPATAGVPSLPTNVFGGLTGVAVNTAAVTGMPAGTSICISQVPGKAASQIDRMLDDGVGTTGSVRITASVAGTHTAPGAGTAAYVETAIYTLCKSL